MGSLSIADIDAKISALHAEIGILTHQRNALIPIATLPTEVLCTVFVFVKLACKNLHIEGECQLLDWVKVTHVCHWWREVGIRASHLWNEIPLHRVKWATEMLARSKGAPLIATGRTERKDHKPLRLDPLQFARIHELNIQCLDYAPLQSIWRVCSVPEKPLPLHTVRLELSTSINGERMLFPTALGELESHLPLLRRLMLNRCGINWKARFICNLTHLRLTGGTYSLECYRINPVLEALKTMPLLETLLIERLNSAKESELSTAKQISVFALPNLKFLGMAAEIDFLGVFMHAVSLPSILAQVIYGYNSRSPTPTSAHSLITSSLSAHPHPKIRTLEFRYDELGRLRIRSWSAALSQMDVSTLRVIPAMQTTYTRWGEGNSELIFIFSQISFDNLVSLSLPWIQLMDAPTWARTFGTLSALEFINIEGGDNAQCLFEALIYSDHDMTVSTILFPSLFSISIEDMNPVFFQNAEAGKALLQDSLIGALIERYELGYEIRELIFVNLPCHWNDLVCRIREVVVDVEVVEKEFWKERSRPLSWMYTSNDRHSVDIMADWMGFWV